MMKSFLMKIMICTWVICSVCYKNICANGDGALVVVRTDTEEEDEASVQVMEEPLTDVFEPTNDWQPIKEGQAIPKGLHVRINLETGLKEAKLLSGDSEENTVTNEANKNTFEYWKEGGRHGKKNLNSQTFTAEELKNALKNFKTTKEGMNAHDEENGDAVKAIRSKYKTYEELKNDLKKLEASVKSETQIVREYVEELRVTTMEMSEIMDSAEKIERLSKVLVELEYYSHQVDNGVELVTSGGLALLVRLANVTRLEWTLRAQAIHCLGSAWNSNSAVQIEGLKLDALRLLLTLLNDKSTPSVHRNKIVYALSALTRHFPIAQRDLVLFGGLSTFSRLIEDTSTALKIQLKIVTLAYDILIERELAKQKLNSSNIVEVERLRQYELTDFEGELIRHGWCRHLCSVLASVESLDDAEKVVEAMWAVRARCAQDLVSVVTRLDALLSQVDEDTPDMKRSLDDLIALLRGATPTRSEL